MKRYTQDEKTQILKEVEETGNAAMVARKHQISLPTVYSWKRSKSGRIENRDEVRKLRKELEDKNLENEVLKALLKKTNQAWLGE